MGPPRRPTSLLESESCPNHSAQVAVLPFAVPTQISRSNPTISSVACFLLRAIQCSLSVPLTAIDTKSAGHSNEEVSGKVLKNRESRGFLVPARAIVDAARIRGYIDLVRGRRSVQKMQRYFFSFTAHEVLEA